MLYPVMISGSTVLKNSAQLCSERHKNIQKDVKGDEENIRKGNDGNMRIFMLIQQCVYLQQPALLCKAQYLRAHYAGTGLEREHCADEGFHLTLPLHHRCYLYHTVFVGLWKDS